MSERVSRVSKRIQTGPNVAEQVRMGPNGSKMGPENFRKPEKRSETRKKNFKKNEIFANEGLTSGSHC